MRSIVFKKRAFVALASLPTNTARTIRSKIELYAENPTALANNVKALRGEVGYRLRVGEWRVLFTLTDTEMIVRDIGTRGSIYD